MNSDQIKQELDSDEFWLLVRRFSMAPEGERRAHAKQAVLLHVAKILDKAPA